MLVINGLMWNIGVNKLNENPLVSVVVSLHNYEKYIADCVKSILKQDYPNIEIVIIDDASTDRSYKVVKKYISDNVRVIRFKHNRGYSVAKNEGSINSKGEYIVMLDADDMLTKRSIFMRMEAMFKYDVDFVHANAIVVNNDISLKQCYKINNPKLECFPTPYHIHAQSVLLKRDLHKKFGLYDETLRSRSDREMWWRFFGQNNKDKMFVSRYYLNESVVYYRYHKKSMTTMRQKKKAYDKRVRKLSENVYSMRKIEGINNKNTRILER